MKTLHSRLLIGGGIAAVVGPLLCVIGMVRGFSGLGVGQEVVQVQVLAEKIGNNMLFFAVGISIGMIGCLALVAGIFVWLNSSERLTAKQRRIQVAR